MAISMGAALIGSAVIGAGASAIGASKNSKAINKATAAQNAADERALQAQREARNQNLAMQQPFYNTGLAANNRINALLGLGSTGPVDSPQTGKYQFGGVSQGQFGNPYVPQGTPGYMGGSGYGDGIIEQRYRDMQYETQEPDPNNYFQMQANGTLAGSPAEQAAFGTGNTQPNELAQAENAFGNWRDNTGYNFRFNEGMRALAAGAPVRNSGATAKAYQRFGQDIGSAEYWNYFGALQDQQRVGVGAANALSGVQTNYANAASGIAQNQGQTAANAAVAKANNTNNMIGGITSSFNNALGAYGSYKKWW
jgi:hypothetical protein